MNVGCVHTHDIIMIAIMQITVCEMEEKQEGVWRQMRRGASIEIQAKRCDVYQTIAQRAAKKLGMTLHPLDTLALFKACGGARILHQDITLKGARKTWTLGNYLQLMKKNPSTVKVGVGIVHHRGSFESSASPSVNQVKRLEALKYGRRIIIMVVCMKSADEVIINSPWGRFRPGSWCCRSFQRVARQPGYVQYNALVCLNQPCIVARLVQFLSLTKMPSTQL